MADLLKRIAQLEAENARLAQENGELKMKVEENLQNNSQTTSEKIPPERLAQLSVSFLAFCEKEKRLAYNTVQSYGKDLSRYIAYLQENGIPHDADSVAVYIAYLKLTHKPRSINRKISALKNFQDYLTKNELKNAMPTALPFEQVPSYALNILERKDLEKMIAVAGSELELAHQFSNPDLTIRALRGLAVLRLLIYAGLRTSEIQELRPENVDLAGGELVFERNKPTERVLEIDKDTCRVLKEYSERTLAASKKTELFFTNARGGVLMRDSVLLIVKKYAEKAGIKRNVTPRMIRDSFAVHSLEDGMSLEKVQYMLGHTDLNSTNKYRRALEGTKGVRQ